MTNPNGRREAPISFRPGKLRALIKQRAVRTLAEGRIVRRDLGRYYLLLGEVTVGELLTRSEGSCLSVAAYRRDVEESFSGDPFIPEHRNPSEYLLSLVQQPITQKGRAGRPATDLEYRLAEKVEAMTPLQRAAVVDAIDRLPFEEEEEAGDAGNWALIGIHLAEDPVGVEDVLRQSGSSSS